MDDIAELFANDTMSDQRRDIMAALRAHCNSPYVKQYGRHILINGGFLSTKPDPKDVDIAVGLRRGATREIMTDPLVNTAAVIKALEGANSPRVRGYQLIDGYADDIGGQKYQHFRDYFQQSDRVGEPPVKGILRVDL